MRLTHIVFSVLLVAVSSAPVDARQTGRRTPPPPPTLDDVGASTVLSALRRGGLILACRHAITDRSGGQRGPVKLGDRSTQRNLSAEGEEQARKLGRALRRLNIPIGEVFASAYARTMESAELAFGRVRPDAMLYGSHSVPALRERFSSIPNRDNTVLMTHQGILRAALGYRQPGEGDCIIVRPVNGKPEVIANVTVREWERLATSEVNRS